MRARRFPEPTAAREFSTSSCVASRKSPRSIRVRNGSFLENWERSPTFQHAPRMCVRMFDHWPGTAHAVETTRGPLET
jgi:hypothetical protein